MIRVKPKKKRKQSQSMAKRRRTRTRTVTRTVRRSARRASSILNKFRPYMAGIGGGVAVETGVSMVAPQAAPIAGYAGAFAFGGPKGLIAKVVFDFVRGRGLPFGFGGGSSNGGLTV